MTGKFYVKEVSLEQWIIYWQQVHKTNILQSWQYGSAKEQAEGWHVLRFLVSDNKGQPVAIAQVLTRSLPLLGGIARLNRGPLLLGEHAEDQMTEKTLTVLRVILREARRRCWWVVQIAPELPNTDKVLSNLMQMGLRRRPDQANASGRLMLVVDEKSLLMGLNGKWRNCLRKGERLGVKVSRYSGTGPEQDLLISMYAELQRSKGFEGLSETLLRSLAMQQGKTWQFDLFIAEDANAPFSNEPIGMLVTVKHGDTTTYLIGSTKARGRELQANSVLLWNAILHAKSAGCTWFDIGGLNSATPKGVAEFKKGLNAIPYQLVGEWRWFYRPWCIKVQLDS